MTHAAAHFLQRVHCVPDNFNAALKQLIDVSPDPWKGVSNVAFYLDVFVFAAKHLGL